MIEFPKCGRLRPAHLARGATPCLRSGAEAGRTPSPRGGGQEELPHVRGQGQRPRVPGCHGAGMAERSYPTSEVRGSGRECQAAMVQEWPRGATPRPRSGVTAESARLRQRRSSQEELPHVGGQGWWLGGATPHLRPGAAAGRSNPTSKERWLRGRRRA